MNKKLKLIFAGDLCVQGSGVNVSKELLDVFRSADFSMVNLEAPILVSLSEASPKSGPVVFQDKSAIEFLKKLEINSVGGANNHVMDYGKDGLDNTINLLKKNKISFTGCGNDITEASQPIPVPGSEMVVIAACEKEFGFAENQSPGVYCFNQGKILDEIKKIRSQKKNVIVFAHGGGEEIPISPNCITEQYRSFIDAGAEIVIGHHPHVAQGFETYEGKSIYYSLGNLFHFLFNRSLGFLLELEVSGSKITSQKLIPISAEGKELKFAKNPEKHLESIKSLNKILQDEEKRAEFVYAEALICLEQYYLGYFKNIFKKNIKEKIVGLRTKFQKEKHNQIDPDLLLLLNLIRNNSHRELIYKGLEVLSGEKTISSLQEKKFTVNQLIESLKNGE